MQLKHRNLKRQTPLALQQYYAYMVALSQIGIKEVPGAKHHPQILRYASACLLRATTDEIAWCSSFVNWCLIMGAYMVNTEAIEALLLKERFGIEEVEQFRQDALILEATHPEVFQIVLKSDQKVILGTNNAMARSNKLFGKEAIGEEGDIGVVERGNDGVSGHVFFVGEHGYNIAKQVVDALGGNQSNRVCNADYSTVRLLAFRKAS